MTTDNCLPFPSFEKRIALTKNDIFTDFTSSNDYRKISFYKVLNRLTILLQYAVCFVLYKENNGRKEVFHNFLKDKLYSETINEKLIEIESSLDSYLFRIFNKEYYLAVFKMEKNNCKDSADNKSYNEIIPVKSILTYFDNNNKDQEIYYRSNGITSVDDYIRLSCRHILGTDQEIKSSYGKLICNSIKVRVLEVEHHKEYVCTAEYKNNMEIMKINFFNELNGIKNKEDIYNYILLRKNSSFNLTYKKLRLSLGLTEKMIEEFLAEAKYEEAKAEYEKFESKYDHKKAKAEAEYEKYKIEYQRIDIFKKPDYKIPNIFFIIRCYNEMDINRYSSYDYNISYVIPKEQEKDITETLQYMKSNKAEFLENNRSYAQYSKSKLDNQAILEDLLDNLDANFWEILESDDGVNQCLVILRSMLGKNTRSFSDRAFSDELVAFYIPFDGGGVSRVAFDNSDIASSNDNLRTVCFYYLALSALPRLEEDQNIGVILSPIMIGDSVWGVSCHFVLMENAGKSFINKKLYFSNYRYCNSVASRAGKDIAKEMREIYLYWLRTIYHQEFMAFVASLYKQGVEIKEKDMECIKNKLEKGINDKFKSLSHFFPYSIIRINVSLNSNDEIENKLYFFNGRGSISFSKEKNLFYPKPIEEYQIFDIDIRDDLLSVFEITQKRIDENVMTIVTRVG